MERETIVGGHKTTISVASDSSEDEEEARKIKEALCDESIYKTTKTVDQINNRTYPEQQTSKEAKTSLLLTKETKKLGLKSNRLQDKNDNEDDNILKTTPEFRSFVARQLSSVLDSVLVDSLQDDVWQVPQTKNVTNTGIRLFSDSDTICTVDVKSEGDQQQQNLIQNTTETRKHRKHKLSTSSESSEDEKIKACVFTTVDIKKENEYLSVIETQTAPSENIKTGVNGSKAHECDTVSKPAINQTTCNNAIINDVPNVTKKKKKKRKKKHNVATDDIS